MEKDDDQIITLILMEKTQVRFNELLRLCKQRINPKYSPRRLKRHLEELEGKFVKRTEKGKQNVVYSLFVPKLDLDTGKIDFNSKIDELRKLSLNQLIDSSLKLHCLLALQEQIILLEKFLKKNSKKDLENKLYFTRAILRDRFLVYQEAMTNRDPAEYQRQLVDLKNEFEELQRGRIQ